ncbi:hypothetical protein M422DRAFT_40970 [Sphaerobolus stellatus SS14]|nr:hypothetical protein M422DRAFT_40970 [Sphaerobolus stellatus SS14]
MHVKNTVNIINLVDLYGQPLAELQELACNRSCLVPKKAFASVDPEKEYSGNGLLTIYPACPYRTVEHKYSGAIIVIFPKKDLLEILCSGDSFYNMLSKLESFSSTPTPEERKMADILTKKLRGIPIYYAKTMLGVALKWKYSNMWMSIMKPFGTQILSQYGKGEFVTALEQYRLEAIQERYKHYFVTVLFDLSINLIHSFTLALKDVTRLNDRVEFIETVLQQGVGSEKEAIIRDWCMEQNVLALSTYNATSIEDIPSLISVTGALGLSEIDK